jgi:hypothetical protein
MNPPSVNFDIVLANLSAISLTLQSRSQEEFAKILVAREAQVPAAAEATARQADQLSNQLSTFPVRAAVVE